MQGCVYEMSRDAYEALWRSEGGAMKKTPYQEVVVSVRDPATQRTVDAITCQVSAWAALRRDGVPSARYLGIIEEGARDAAAAYRIRMLGNDESSKFGNPAITSNGHAASRDRGAR